MSCARPAVVASGILLAFSALLSAAIPEDVTVTVFARPEGSHLQLLLRVPMVVFGDIRFPLRGSENYLDIPATNVMLPGVARYWIAPSLEVYENGHPLPQPVPLETRLALESDQSFASYESALTHLNGPSLDPSANLYWRQAWVDILFDVPIRSSQSDFSVRFSLAHLGMRVVTNLRFLSPNGADRAFSYEGDPGLTRLDPRWYEAALSFIQWGFLEFFNGTDYLLFVFCLVLPLRSTKAILPLVLAFICASSATLIASAFGLSPSVLWFPSLIQTAMAVGILYFALANIAGWLSPGRRAILTLCFGLVYGFGFAFDLSSKIQFAGSHPLVSAFAFNLGIQLAFAAAAAVLASVVASLLRFPKLAKIEIWVPSILAAHTAWHWMIERWDRFHEFPLRWPDMDAAFFAILLRWLMILVLLFGGARLVSGMFGSSKTGSEPAA